MVIDHVVLGEVEERIVLQERILEMRALDGVDLDVGGDAAAAVHGAAAVGQFDFAVRGSLAVIVGAIEIIVVQRDVGIVALNQASTGSVVMGGLERESRIFG